MTHGKEPPKMMMVVVITWGEMSADFNLGNIEKFEFRL